MKLTPTKTRGMGIPYGENFIILTSTVFVWYSRLTDGRTGDSIIARYKHICCRALKTFKFSTSESPKYAISIPQKICPSQTPLPGQARRVPSPLALRPPNLELALTPLPLTPAVVIWVRLKASCARLSFVIFDIRALWCSALSVRVPRCQKLQVTA